MKTVNDNFFLEKHQTYTNINTLYKREIGSKKKSLIIGDFSQPEFEYLCDNQLICEEKIEGTNVHCFWNGHDRIFYGKTENAEIPLHLLAKMEVLFPIEKLKEVFPLKYDEQGLEMPFEARIYGEGYGIKIQKGQQ